MSPSVCQIPLQVANISVRVYLFEHNIFIFLTVNHVMYMFDISSGMVIDKVKAYVWVQLLSPTTTPGRSRGNQV